MCVFDSSGTFVSFTSIPRERIVRRWQRYGTKLKAIKSRGQDSPGFRRRRRRRSCATHAYDRYATAFSIVSLMIHVGVTAPGVEEAVSNRECNEPRIVSKILIRQESSPDADASTSIARANAASFVKLCARDDGFRFAEYGSYRLVSRLAQWIRRKSYPRYVVDDSETY